MTETEDQIEKLNNMPYKERFWRTYIGVMGLRGLAEWKAGAIVLRSMVFTISLGLLISYFAASLISVPIILILGLEPSISSLNVSSLTLHIIAFVFFLWVVPGLALREYYSIRTELEKLTRKEGTFWQYERPSD